MRLIYSLLLIFTVYLQGIAQKAIKIDEIDIELLTKEIHDDLMLFRDTNKIARYVEDPILAQAAQLQGEYCIKNSTTTHFHKSNKLKEVEQRVLYFNGHHGNLHEIIVEVNVKHVQAHNYHEMSELILRNALRNKAYKSFLRSKRGSSIGLYLNKTETSVYMVIVLGTPPVFSDKFNTPKGLYGLKNVDDNHAVACKLCDQKIAQMGANPIDLTIMDDKIYFVISSKSDLNKIFVNKYDGVAVDIMRKIQYPCGDPNVMAEGAVNNGYLLPPVFTDNMLTNAVINDAGIVFVPVGEVPLEWRSQDYELNLLVIQNNVVCRYNTFFQIPFGDSEPLDLKFYLNTSGKDVQFENTVSRQMDFTVPFEQGKHSFDKQDLKPLMDSLNLANYNIKKLDIMAYSSIEGSVEKNAELQQKRAQSIIDVLSQNQKEEVHASIRTVENWVDFFRDVQHTDHAYLADKTKEYVLEYVNHHRVASVDKILNKHRKAIVNVTLERKNKFDEMTTTAIDKLCADANFQSSDDKYWLIEDVYQTGSVSLLSHLEASVINDDRWSAESKGKIVIYLYQLDSTQLKSSIKKLGDLVVEKSDSEMLTYNYYAMRLLDWKNDLSVPPSPVFKREIWNSKVLSKEKDLRLRFNFDLMETIYQKSVGNKAAADKCVYDAYAVTTHLFFDEEESFVVAKFLANNNKYKEAIKLLKDHVTKINADEDLLFLYINLTIIDDAIIKKADYRTILSNASIVNSERFCKIFKSSFNGGITFQLLNNRYLKRSHCEMCH